MIYVEDCTDRCYAEIFDDCSVLTNYETCGNECRFYKPVGCADWIRVRRNGSDELYAPEEYERRYAENEKDRKHRALYWRIKNVSVRKGRLR